MKFTELFTVLYVKSELWLGGGAPGGKVEEALNILNAKFDLQRSKNFK